MIRISRLPVVTVALFLAVALVLVWGLSGAAQAKEFNEGKGIPKDLARMEQRLLALEREVGIQHDVTDIRRLMNIYGYFMEANLRTRLVDLFTDNDPSVLMVPHGLYRGSKERVRTAFIDVDGGGRPDGGATFGGHLSSLSMVHDVITVAPDRKTAKGRFKGILLFGSFAPPQYAMWMFVTYENDFVREQGIWKIKNLRVYGMFAGPYDSFWKNPWGPPSTPAAYPPDETMDVVHAFPEAYIHPFHFRHPITGEMVPTDMFYDATQSPYWCRDAQGNWGVCP